MPGFVADPAPWYAHGELFLLPSRWEGFAHVLVEAMACGLPAIAFNCPYGPAEILLNESGVLVTPNDVSALTHAIDRLLATPGDRAALANAGLLAIQRFSRERIVNQFVELIEKVAAKRTKTLQNSAGP
jgi:glycosyltransferase involved in cell wall biosynthesis